MSAQEHDTKRWRSCLLRLRTFATRHGHRLGLLAFLVGFALDSSTLPAVDDVAAHVLVLGYLALVMLGILIQQFLEHRLATQQLGRPFVFAMSFLPVLTQLLFGALFSALLIFYFRSASIAGSWLFLTIVFLLAIGNELFRARFARLEFQLGLLFFLVYAYAIYALPLVGKTMGANMFLLSGVVSVAFGAGYFALLAVIAPEAARRVFSRILLFVGGILFIVQALYVTRLIPPIPLVLVESGVYHLVVRSPDGDYHALAEDPRATSWDRWGPVTIFRRTPGASAYFFSAVYAPIALETPIIHEWQHYDSTQRTWSLKSRILFPIVGGRREGYRGYSEKSFIDTGYWRVIVKTAEGREIGRATFIVVDAPREGVVLRERRL